MMSKVMHRLHTPCDGGTSARQADPPTPAHAKPMSSAGVCHTTVPQKGLCVTCTHMALSIYRMNLQQYCTLYRVENVNDGRL
jgi:hypothetical protein